MQESPCSSHCYSNRHHSPHSWAEQSELGNGEDTSPEELSMSQDSKDEGESEMGHPPAQTSSPLDG